MLGPFPTFRFVNIKGEPIFGGRVYIFKAGTAEPVALYQDQEGLIRHAFPVILNVNGEAAIFYDSSLKTDVRVEDYSGLPVYSTHDS